VASYFFNLLQAYQALMQGFMMFAGGQPVPQSRPQPQPRPQPPTQSRPPRESTPTAPVPRGFKTAHSTLFSGPPQQQVQQARAQIQQYGVGQHGNLIIHQAGFGGRFVVALTDQKGSTTIQVGKNDNQPSLVTQGRGDGVNPNSFEVKNDSARALTPREFQAYRNR
jgi:hypothetical protein